MNLDILTLTVVGMLLCGVMASLLALSLSRFPAVERRSLKVWTVGLALQPLAWTLYSIRGNTPDVPLSAAANLLLILGFAEMTRAVRIFVGVPERRLSLYAIAAGVALAVGIAAAWSRNFSLLVILNAVGVSLTLLLMLMPLLASLRTDGAPVRMLAGFAVLGVVILGARAVEHLLRPQIGGSFLAPSLADTIAVSYAAFGPVIVNFAFVLMHQERAYAAMQRLATTDGLTGLLNRRAFETAAVEQLAAADRLGESRVLLLLDLDHFKQINDHHGHATGDRVLEETARRIRTALQPGELAARMGGEEMALLLCSGNGAARAEELRLAIAGEPISIGEGRTLTLTTSIGVVTRVPRGASLNALLSVADRAMYRAKTEGRNRVQLAETEAPTRPA